MSTKLEFITQVSAESVTSLTTPQVFSAEYDTYFVQMQIAGNTTYNEIYLTDSSNNVLNDSTNDVHYRGAMLVMKSDTSFAENRVGTATYVGWRELGVYIDNAGEGYGMSFYVYNPFSSSKYTFVQSQSAGMISNNLWGGKAVGIYESAEQCNGLKFSNSGGGTMEYIIANIYGVK